MSDANKKLNEFEEQGIIVVENALPSAQIETLRRELVVAISEDSSQNEDVFDCGMVHNCMVRGQEMQKVISQPVLNDYVDNLFTPHAIIYAYQSSSLNAESGNYGSRVHVDCPRFIDNYMTNLGVIIALDDFTAENGGTYYLPESHKTPSTPSDEYFYENCRQLECKKGSLIFFNGRLFHAAGRNNTSEPRHALTINYCRPFMRQRFDFPRLIPKSQLDAMDEVTKQRVGFNVRMPTSLGEFYLPSDRRLYKPGQE